MVVSLWAEPFLRTRVGELREPGTLGASSRGKRGTVSVRCFGGPAADTGAPLVLRQ